MKQGIDKIFCELVEKIMKEGTRQKNRTGVDTFMIPSAIIQYDLANNPFPLLTVKRVPWKAVRGELIGFIRGFTSAAEFREVGCKFWDQNANETASWVNNRHRKGEDDLGMLPYSICWTQKPNGIDPSEPINQFASLVVTLKHNPADRRMVVSSWSPELFERAALPPCHITWGVVFDQEKKAINLWWNQRSVDTYLGLGANIASYAMLCHMLAAETGYKVGTLTGFLADVHLYENHLDACKEMLSRDSVLTSNAHCTISDEMDIFHPVMADIDIEEYYPHPAIPAPMAA